MDINVVNNNKNWKIEMILMINSCVKYLILFFILFYFMFNIYVK